MDVSFLALGVLGAVFGRNEGHELCGSRNGVAVFLSLGIARMGLLADEAHVESACGEVAYRHLFALFAVEDEEYVGREDVGVDIVGRMAHVLSGAEGHDDAAVLYLLVAQEGADELHGYGTAALVVGAKEGGSVGAHYGVSVAGVDHGVYFAAFNLGRHIEMAAYAQRGAGAFDV